MKKQELIEFIYSFKSKEDIWTYLKTVSKYRNLKYVLSVLNQDVLVNKFGYWEIWTKSDGYVYVHNDDVNPDNPDDIYDFIEQIEVMPLLHTK